MSLDQLSDLLEKLHTHSYDSLRKAAAQEHPSSIRWLMRYFLKRASGRVSNEIRCVKGATKAHSDDIQQP